MATQRKQKKGALTRQTILDAAIRVSERTDYYLLNRAQVAIEADVCPTLVPYHFGTMTQFRRSIMREAIRTNNLRIIACGLIHKDCRALACADEVKREALAAML